MKLKLLPSRTTQSYTQVITTHLTIWKHKLFEKATDIKYNKTKFIGMWLGSNRGNNTKPVGFKWTSHKIKILGYTYSPDTNVKYEENREKVRKKYRMIGKKTRINQSMFSKVWYLAYVERPPEQIIQNIKKNIQNFLWNHRKVRVHRNTLTLPIKLGGLVLIDIDTQCKAIQVLLLLNSIGKYQTIKFGQN